MRFKELLERLPINFEDYTFIDIGSGKGAALFHASEYPFAEIIGVEFAPALHETSLRNIASFRSTTQRCNKITAVCQDAASYEFPEGPLVLFLNVPFGLPIWKPVAANLARALRGKGKSYLIFFNYRYLPDAADYVTKLKLLKLIEDSVNVRIYEISPDVV